MTVAVPRPTSGVMDGNAHLFPIRIYYEETDAGRMVYHASYLKFAERARTEMMRVNGLDHLSLMESEGLVFTVHSVDIRYLNQAKLDDELLVRTQVAGNGGASMHMSQKVFRIEKDEMGQPVVEIDLRLALVDENGRPKRLPGHLKSVLDELRDEEG